MWGLCQSCLAKEQEREMMDIVATPEKLRHHPDLAEVDTHLDEHYPT